MARLPRIVLGLAVALLQQAQAQPADRSPGVAPRPGGAASAVVPPARAASAVGAEPGVVPPARPASARGGEPGGPTRVDRPRPSAPPRFPPPPPPAPWRPQLPQLVPQVPDAQRPAAAPSLPPSPVLPSSPEATHEPGELLVLWPSLAEAQRGQQLLQQQYQLTPRQRHVLDNLGGVLALLVLPSEADAVALRDRLRAEQPGWVVDLNARARPQQAAAPRLYARQMLGAVTPARTGAPPNLRIGVVDTQVSPRLVQPAALNGSVALVRSVLEAGDRAADPAHGDALLQLIAGAERDSGFAGAGPRVQLFWAAAMRDLDGKASTNSLLLAQAFDWLLGQRVALVNLSLGGAGDAILQAVIARVLAANVSVVAAAGNNPAPAAPATYPAAYPGVWAATAVDAAGRLYAGATRAPYVMLAAPGVEVWVPAGDEGLYVSGTSYAAALATATLAWQPADFWRLSPAQRAAEVCARARKLEGEAFAGCGLVQRASAP